MISRPPDHDISEAEHGRHGSLEKFSFLMNPFELQSDRHLTTEIETSLALRRGAGKIRNDGKNLSEQESDCQPLILLQYLVLVRSFYRGRRFSGLIQ